MPESLREKKERLQQLHHEQTKIHALTQQNVEILAQMQLLQQQQQMYSQMYPQMYPQMYSQMNPPISQGQNENFAETYHSINDTFAKTNKYYYAEMVKLQQQIKDLEQEEGAGKKHRKNKLRASKLRASKSKKKKKTKKTIKNKKY